MDRPKIETQLAVVYAGDYRRAVEAAEALGGHNIGWFQYHQPGVQGLLRRRATPDDRVSRDDVRSRDGLCEALGAGAQLIGRLLDHPERGNKIPAFEQPCAQR